jgi:hypothetical protein
MRGENKKIAFLTILIRILIEGYKLYRVWFFLDSLLSVEVNNYKTSVIVVFVTAIMDEIVLVLIIVSTIKCVKNFGKGFKEILIKQVKANVLSERIETTSL